MMLGGSATTECDVKGDYQKCRYCRQCLIPTNDASFCHKCGEMDVAWCIGRWVKPKHTVNCERFEIKKIRKVTEHGKCAVELWVDYKNEPA